MRRVLSILSTVWVSLILASSASVPAKEQVHEVRTGDSASSIARRYYGGFEFTDLLLRYNGKVGSVLQPGERLRVPYSEVYTIRAGDTWSRIAQQFLGRASDYEVLARMNGLEPDRPLRVGNRIRIPVFLSHSLEGGETLDALAELYYGDSRRGDLLRDYNRIDDPRRLSVGATIEVPLMLPLAEKPPADPQPTQPAPPARRFEEHLRSAREAFHAGSYEDVLETLAPLIQPIETEGNELDRTELWELLAFVYVAFDRNDEACAAYGLMLSESAQTSLDPDLVSPKIRKVLASCR